jgi:hypothetical protein
VFVRRPGRRGLMNWGFEFKGRPAMRVAPPTCRHRSSTPCARRPFQRRVSAAQDDQGRARNRSQLRRGAAGGDPAVVGRR